MYTKNGVISVKGFKSLNDNGVKNETFLVAEGEDNKIIYGDADYSEVDKAIKAANKLNKAKYKDFSAVEKAIAAVVREKNVLEQKDVDAMAKAINNAIKSPKKDEKDKTDDTPKTGVEDLTSIAIFIALGSLAGIVRLSKEQ